MCNPENCSSYAWNLYWDLIKIYGEGLNKKIIALKVKLLHRIINLPQNSSPCAEHISTFLSLSQAVLEAIFTIVFTRCGQKYSEGCCWALSNKKQAHKKI